MIILGIDPGLAIVGFGIIEKKLNGNICVIDYGVINTPKEENTAVRIAMVYDGITELIEKYKPDVIALEELFYNSNQKTVISVAEARGAILLAGIKNCGNMYEYTPLQIKQALTGQGRAEKQQVQYMVKLILNLTSIPRPDDAADALAVAICHSQTNNLVTKTSNRI
ncbi:MAG: crossover junction endodeoxyribonuclease RuvC [Clostridia bacterium]|nr:crossover junction endodeoxyribonuclease RuvC [Clostridia bacterium]MDD4275459.1 crossover junction endodeoxyribonuclease RuvC [Clostridia bacterium]